jgi:hypothetical protein
MPEALTKAVACLDEHLLGDCRNMPDPQAQWPLQPAIEPAFALPWADFPNT